MLSPKNNAEGQLFASIDASTLTLVLNSGEGDKFPTGYKNTTTSAGTSTTLNCTGIQAALSAIGITDTGFFIRNITDGSSAVVTAINTNSLTTTKLKGGTDNTWQNSDEFAIGSCVITLNKRDSSGEITTFENVLIKYADNANDTLYVESRGYAGTSAVPFAKDDYVSLLMGESLLKGLIDSASVLFQDKAEDSETVHKTGNETIAGTKTFSSPVKGQDATASDELVTKSQLDASSGGESIELGENLTAGEVIRAYDDSGQKIKKVTTSSEIGTLATILTNDAYDIGMKPIDGDGNGKVLVCYRDQSDFDGYGVVGTIADGNITFGTPVKFTTNQAQNICVAYDSNADKFLVTYKDTGANDWRGIVATISGTTVSFGASSQIESDGGQCGHSWLDFDDNENRFLIVYRKPASPFSPRARTATISGTSVSFGTAIDVDTNNGTSEACAFDSVNNKFLVIYNRSSSIYGTVVTISGTSCSAGSNVQLSTKSPYNFSYLDFDPDSGKFAVVGNEGSDGPGFAFGVKISGTTPSADSEIALSGEHDQPKIVYGEGRFLETHFDSSGGYDALGQYLKFTNGALEVEGSAFTIESDGQTAYPCPIWDDLNKLFAVVFNDNQNSDFEANTVMPPTADKAVGVIQETGTTGQSKPVKLLGQVDESGSGLTIGEIVCIQSDSTLGHTETDYPFGRAIDTTKNILTKNP